MASWAATADLEDILKGYHEEAIGAAHAAMSLAIQHEQRIGMHAEQLVIHDSRLDGHDQEFARVWQAIGDRQIAQSNGVVQQVGNAFANGVATLAAALPSRSAPKTTTPLTRMVFVRFRNGSYEQIKTLEEALTKSSDKNQKKGFRVYYKEHSGSKEYLLWDPSMGP